MEWDIRRANVFFYGTPEAFQKVHGYGPTVLAVSKERDNTIHLGPKVTLETFDTIVGHELVHIILYQKYKDAIPTWLVEGLANYASKKPVDYKWLSTQPFIEVTSLTHPYKGNVNFKYHYLASTAVMEMIASRCSMKDLLQLSVGKKIETYLKTYCEITDLNGDFKKWIAKKAN